MKDKEKQITEMAKDLEKVEKEVYSKITKETYAYVKEHHRYNSKEDYSLAHTKTVFELTAEEMTKLGWIKTNKDSVVLSAEEYCELKQAKSLLELREKTIKYLEDANIRYAKALELKVNKKERKETAEKIFDILYQWLDLENIEKYGFVTIQKFDFLRKFREIYRQFGVEIKE